MEPDIGWTSSDNGTEVARFLGVIVVRDRRGNDVGRMRPGEEADLFAAIAASERRAADAARDTETT